MTIVHALRTVADSGSGHGIQIFRDDREVERIGYQRLYVDAGEVAAGLLAAGVADEERIAVALPTSIDHARAFFGVIAAGGVPVPVPPPFRFGSVSVYAQRISLVMRQSGIRKMLTTEGMQAVLRPEFPDCVLLTVGDLRSRTTGYVDVTADRPALVQYTSGTVNNPKGVVLTHANVLANVESIRAAVHGSTADVCCSWLPLFHDMGLIGKLLFAVLNDMRLCLQSPEDFLRDPGRWVRMISRCGGTLVSSPNSGYRYAFKKVPVDAVAELDLRSWRLALNGAETVEAATMDAFAEHFAPAGFRRTAFLPVYGLAEASLAVSFPSAGQGPKTYRVRRDRLTHGDVVGAPVGAERGREVVSVGTPVPGTEIRLVDPDGAVVDADVVGEIQIRGASVLRVYEGGRPAAGDDGWVSTGDLGFRHDGELYIAGRRKEIIVVLGQNHYASDIESIAGSVPGVVDDAAMAVGVFDDSEYADGEGVVLFVETVLADESDRAKLTARVRSAVSTVLGIVPREVIAVRRGKLPRTSSGKLERRGTKPFPAKNLSDRFAGEGLVPSTLTERSVETP